MKNFLSLLFVSFLMFCTEAKKDKGSNNTPEGEGALNGKQFSLFPSNSDLGNQLSSVLSFDSALSKKDQDRINDFEKNDDKVRWYKSPEGNWWQTLTRDYFWWIHETIFIAKFSSCELLSLPDVQQGVVSFDSCKDFVAKYDVFESADAKKGDRTIYEDGGSTNSTCNKNLTYSDDLSKEEKTHIFDFSIKEPKSDHYDYNYVFLNKYPPPANIAETVSGYSLVGQQIQLLGCSAGGCSKINFKTKSTEGDQVQYYIAKGGTQNNSFYLHIKSSSLSKLLHIEDQSNLIENTSFEFDPVTFRINKICHRRYYMGELKSNSLIITRGSDLNIKIDGIEIKDEYVCSTDQVSLSEREDFFDTRKHITSLDIRSPGSQTVEYGQDLFTNRFQKIKNESGFKKVIDNGDSSPACKGIEDDLKNISVMIDK